MSRNCADWAHHTDCVGWTVVPDVIGRDKADACAGEAYKWIESWGLGFDRHDPKTRRPETQPWSVHSGLYARYVETDGLESV